MPQLSPGSSFNNSLTPGAWVTVKTDLGASAFVRITPTGGATQNTTVPSATTRTFGPFNQQCQIAIDAVAQPCTVDLSPAAFRAHPITIVSAAAPVNNDGMPDGTVYIQSAT
ncbi:MAG: hypothetical protein JWP29_4831 [Rhodoferax sp.]|nr:hypothetical protein [Rhodoferax sp.]